MGREPSDASFTTRTPPQLHLISQVFSAVMYAQSVKSLSIDWTAERLSRRDRTRLMRWITASLFSNRARHSIETVELGDFSVEEADMDDLETLLLSNNPLRVLRGDEDQGKEQCEAHHQVFLAEGTKLLLNPVGTRPVPMNKWKVVQLARDLWADVVDDDTGDDAQYCEVIVPGYGLCGVQRSDVLSQRSINNTTRASHGIKSLKLSMDGPPSLGNDYAGLSRFFHLVGAPLEELIVSHVEEFTLCLDTVWAACPLLVRLDLRHVSSDILRRIADAYESGNCRVSSLRLRDLQRNHGSHDILQFFEKLADPERAISRTLTELTVSVHRFRYEQTTDQEMASMVKMRENNTTLAFISINAPASNGSAMLRMKNNHPLPGRGVPLEMRVKLAFLSAVDSTPTLKGASNALGSDVVLRIFELASRPVVRKVLSSDLY